MDTFGNKIVENGKHYQKFIERKKADQKLLANSAITPARRRDEAFLPPPRMIMPPAKTLNSTRRIDLYANSGTYATKRIKPGFLTKMLLAATPSLMGCWGRLFGCMQCIVFRSTIRLDTPGCTPPCVAGVGSFCGAATGELTKKYFSTFSVVCSELFRQASHTLNANLSH
jgi:hypothetical protein